MFVYMFFMFRKQSHSCADLRLQQTCGESSGLCHTNPLTVFHDTVISGIAKSRSLNLVPGNPCSKRPLFREQISALEALHCSQAKLIVPSVLGQSQRAEP